MLMTRIGSAPVIIFAALVVLAAQLTTNMAANVVSPSNDFSNLSPRRISYVTGGLITAVIGILMMPWKLYSDAAAYIFTWLIGYSSLMGALGGILIADYWVIRQQQLDCRDLFRMQRPLHLRQRRQPARDHRARARGRCRSSRDSCARRRRPAAAVANPDILRHALHVRVVRDVRAELSSSTGC